MPNPPPNGRVTADDAEEDTPPEAVPNPSPSGGVKAGVEVLDTPTNENVDPVDGCTFA